MSIEESINEAYRRAAERYANEPPFINNDVFRLNKKIKEYKNSGNKNEIVRAQLELASIFNKRVLELRNYFRDNNIDSGKDLAKPDVRAKAKDWLKNKGWWIPFRDDLSKFQDEAWRINVSNSYGELYNYLPHPQVLLTIAYRLNTDAMKQSILNSGINQSEAERIFNMWDETNKLPKFNYPESERTRRARAAESRRTSTGGKKRRRTIKR